MTIVHLLIMVDVFVECGTCMWETFNMEVVPYSYHDVSGLSV